MGISTNANGERIAERDAQPVEPAEWFTVDDLARRFRMSRRSVFRYADSGRLPWGMTLGQLRRWSRREIEAFEAGGCKPLRVAKAKPRPT